MKATIYLPYYSIYDDGYFDVSDDYYKSDSDYVNAIASNVKNTRNAIVNYVENGATNVYKSSDGQIYKYDNKSQNDVNKVSYAQCDAVIFNANGENESVDNFISEYVSKKPQLYIISLNLDTSDEDFEQELNLWTKDHNELQKYSSAKGDEWILDNEPVRDLRLEFLNNANEKTYAVLKNCKIMEKQGIGRYVILVNQINLIDKIE